LKKEVKQVLQFIIFLALGLLLLWVAFRNVRFRELAEGLKSANYLFVLLSVAFSIFAYLSRARRWNLLIHPLGYKPSFMNTFNALMTGYFANLALPRIGEITRCVALGKKEDIPADKLIGTVVVERAVDMMALLIIMTVMIFTSGDRIRQFLKETIFIPVKEQILIPAGQTWLIWSLVLLILAVLLWLVVRYRKRLGKIPLVSEIFKLSKGIITGLKSITRLEKKWEFLFHTVFMWICYIFMTWVVVFAIDNTSHLGFRDAIFLLVIGGFAMVVPVPAGMGAFHYIISRGLAFVQGVNLEDGALYAILTHESQVIMVIIVGIVSSYMIFRKDKGKEAAEKSADSASAK
jgi:hypothetical protein